MKNLAAVCLSSALVFFSGNLLSADEEAPMTVAGAKTITTAEAKQLFDSGALFIDPRRDSDHEAGRIPDSLHLEMTSVFTKESLSAAAKPDDPIVFYCNGPKCLRSATCSEQAVSWGFTRVHYYRDGFPAWQEAGFPVE